MMDIPADPRWGLWAPKSWAWGRSMSMGKAMATASRVYRGVPLAFPPPTLHRGSGSTLGPSRSVMQTLLGLTWYSPKGSHSANP